jgi:hypothetical protein
MYQHAATAEARTHSHTLSHRLYAATASGLLCLLASLRLPARHLTVPLALYHSPTACCPDAPFVDIFVYWQHAADSEHRCRLRR